MKYELTTNTKTFNGIILYQIKALKDFGIIKNGSLGGWIEKIENLSQDGEAWVYENARVSGNAMVYENARVSGNALVYENALVYGNAMVSGNALVYENARVSGNAWVYENARVYGNAMVSGNAWVYENARVNQSILLSSGLTNFDCSQNLLGTIRNSLNLMPVNGELLFYKRVRSDLSSEFDSSFYYKIGEEVVVEDFHPDTSISCGKGIHGSHANYYPLEENKVILALSSKIEDIICCQEGKIRVKKAKVLGICDV
jgi:carbonic anhydrase/acetyltransferase-like protein (isoleucine patch superfamily)